MIGIKSIGIIGNGVVGHATARCFMEHAEVRVYDIIGSITTHHLPDVLSSNIVFICLPTPQKKDSLECDTSAIDTFLKEAVDKTGDWICDKRLVLRSTVPIGYTSSLRDRYNLDIVHSPEFLTARCAVTDAQLPARNIIGGQPSICRTLLYNLYRLRFPGVQCHVMSSDESEAVKLFVNGFFATKIAYFNEIHSLAAKLGLNWPTVLKAMLADGRIAHSHTSVPGPDGKYGFGGSCLPKDLANLVDCINKAGDGYVSHVTSAAGLRNDTIDRRGSN